MRVGSTGCPPEVVALSLNELVGEFEVALAIRSHHRKSGAILSRSKVEPGYEQQPANQRQCEQSPLQAGSALQGLSLGLVF